MRRVEYQYGKDVIGITKHPGGGFELKFEDGTKLIYNDTDVEKPDNIKNAKFTDAVFSPTKATLYFQPLTKAGEPSKKKLKLDLRSISVGISDATGTVHWPAKTEEVVEPLPDDPSSERAAEGPENPDGKE